MVDMEENGGTKNKVYVHCFQLVEMLRKNSGGEEHEERTVRGRSQVVKGQNHDK